MAREGRLFMSPKEPEGCVKPAKGLIKQSSEPSSAEVSGVPSAEEVQMRTLVGHEAPDFEATAYFKGEFRNVKLSDFRGKWVMVCFYPGDFTYV